MTKCCSSLYVYVEQRVLYTWPDQILSIDNRYLAITFFQFRLTLPHVLTMKMRGRQLILSVVYHESTTNYYKRVYMVDYLKVWWIVKSSMCLDRH